jgi:cytochrome P450
MTTRQVTSGSDETLDQRVKRLAANLDFASPELLDESLPFLVYNEIRETAPVLRLGTMGGYLGSFASNSWFVTRYADVVRVFRDDYHFTSSQISAGGVPGPVPKDECPFDQIDPLVVAKNSQKIPLTLDPPEFFAYRSLLNPLLSPGQAKSLEGDTRQIANKLLDGSTTGGRIDIHKTLAKPLPAIMTCRILGLPEENWDSYLISHGDTSGYDTEGGEGTPEQILARVMPSIEAQMALLEMANRRRSDPRDDMITKVAHLAIDGRRLGFYEVGAILSELLAGGLHTTTMAIESAAAFLGRNPEQQRMLAADPARIPAFAEEVLRMWPPLPTFTRSAKLDAEVGGQLIKAGDSLILGLASANRDPREFPEPDAFTADRYPNRHLTFTVGIHRCIGSSLARMQLRVAIETLLARVPDFTLDEDNVRIPPMNDGAFGPDRALVASFPLSA